MRRTTPLTVAAMVGLALLAPTASASAAGETCRGEAATIVGTGPDVTGTEGRDVIVTGGSLRVTSLGGDDLICVAPVGTRSNVLYVDAGTGADLVDTTSATLAGYYVDTDLGPGADTLEGGPAGDWVDTGDVGGSTADVDVVRAGAGGDTVTTSGGSDVIHLGPGDNMLRLDGPGTTPEGLLAGGNGYDTLTARVDATGAFDMAAGTYVGEGGSARFSSFEGLYVEAHGAELTYSGTEGADHVTVETYGPDPTLLVASTLAGDDNLWLDRTLLAPGTRIDTGSGDDHLVAARSTGRLALDLKRDTLEATGHTFPATGIEDAFLMARRVSLVGDARDNTLIAHACTTEITGGHGDDELIWDRDYIFEEYSVRCAKSATMRGGRGKDSFYGSPGGDRLHGDGGRDTIRGEGGRDLADGGPGRDRCSAERERRCER